MKCLNPLARKHRDLLQSLAHVSTDGVSVAFLKRCVPEAFANGRINLPTCCLDKDMAEILAKTWRHELQHARDCLDGIDLPVEQMEQRARLAAHSPRV